MKKQNSDLFFSSCVFFAKKTVLFRKKQACFFRVATLPPPLAQRSSWYMQVVNNYQDLSGALNV